MPPETTALITPVKTSRSKQVLRKAAPNRSPSHPSPALLRRYRGASVRLRINGVSASGVLSFADDGSPFIASLCFTQGDSECPLFSHVLADHEIATLRRNGPRHLTSAIAITFADRVLHSDCHA